MARGRTRVEDLRFEGGDPGLDDLMREEALSTGNRWVVLCAQCKHKREFDNRQARDLAAGRHNESTGHPVLLTRHEEEQP